MKPATVLVVMLAACKLDAFHVCSHQLVSLRPKQFGQRLFRGREKHAPVFVAGRGIHLEPQSFNVAQHFAFHANLATVIQFNRQHACILS